MSKKFNFLLQRLSPSILVNIWLSIKYRCLVDPSAKIYWPKNLKLAKGVRIGKGSIIIAQGDKDSIVLKKNVAIEEYCVLNSKGGKIILGENSDLNQFSLVQSTKDNITEVGNNVAIAPYTRIVPNHKYEGEKRAGTVHASTKISDNAWIGAGVTIVIGSNIGKNSIVGANSVVTKDIPDNIVAAGTPAKLIKTFQEYVQKKSS